MNRTKHYRTLIMRCYLVISAFALIALNAANVYATDNFNAGTLRGVQSVQVEIAGIPTDFQRYGLSAETMKSNIEQRLVQYGLTVLDPQAAISNKNASQVYVRLHANQDTYSNYSCRIAFSLKRKIPLDASGTSFVAETVWSKGRSGLLNPSDLPRIYGYVDALVDQFISEHGQHNPSPQASLVAE